MKLIDYQPIHIDQLTDEHINKLTKSDGQNSSQIAVGIECLAIVNQPNNFRLKRFNDSINRELTKMTQ